MGHGKIRKDKTCLNCNYVVESNFCPNCGQENSEPKQSFHYLFTHFIEDLTHYDGSFWKTVKYLLFHPGRLTREYLEGKRKKFVPPVKLYIFISFITFFIPTILPDTEEEVKTTKVKEVDGENFTTKINNGSISLFDSRKVKTLKELDSLQKSLPEKEKFTYIQYTSLKTYFKTGENLSKKEFREKGFESFTHNLPKVLFFYMPVFAFFLWLLHDKKKWYYFDNGVFTLHYFSFLLLVITICIIFNWLLDIIYYIDFLSALVGITSVLYSFFYFFRAHRRIYGESKLISRLKGFLLFFVNMFLIFSVLICLFIYSLMNVH